ncbi:MAG: 3-phosphoserine/phosphohydroxythreonine aminotransferase [Bacteroidetes bacterium]|nr:MAG: 3-phosphoserine/phosphohydroxythreonine aminotransferase [Bacteroidota bacterium]
MSKVHNFSAGPCILPKEVLTKASEAVINFNNLDLSLIEISHRSKDFVEVMDWATSLVKELLNVPEGYSVIFLQGGASTQFLMVAYNLLTENGTGAYLNTGTWASKAIKEAEILGTVKVLASSEDKNFNYIPKGYSIPLDADYLHITSNNTIFGTQVKEFPECPVTLVCDMSSDIFSRKINVSDFGLIYAGAQKNMGPAGATMVIIKDEILGKVGRAIPSMLNYQIHIKKESMYNTPPVFAVYVSMLTLEWLKDVGGVEAIQKVNNAKAELIYGEIDRNPLFRGIVAEEDRSTMNATFVLEDESMNDAFNQALSDARINGLKGHRSVGGFRASMYNALPLESVQVLVDVMSNFRQ